jgi:hypothetical protein
MSMNKHPYSKLHESQGAGFPTPATLEERGRTWRDASEEYLIGFVMESWGTDSANQTSAVVEMQRRLMHSVRAAGDSADTQAVEIINLTRALKVYTIVLAVIGAVQIGIMLWKG